MPSTVLIISAADPCVFGGQEKQTVDLIRALRNDYRFLLLAEKGRLTEAAAGSAIVLERPLRGRNILRSIIDVKDVIVAQNVDIVHTLELRGNLIGRFAARLIEEQKRPKVVATRHEFIYSPFFSLKKRVSRRIYGTVEKLTRRYCDNYIAVSEAIKEEIISRLNVPAQKVTVIHNGVSRSAGQKPPGEKALVIGFVGRLIREKGVDDLIDAAPIILDKLPNLKFVVVGTGPDLPHITRRIDGLGLSQVFQLVGHVEDIGARLDDFKLLAFPSRHESFGMVIVEAMQRGLPVVGTKVGGIPEIIKPGVNGLLVEPRRPDQLAEGIVGLLSDEEKLDAMGREAALTAREFTIERMAGLTKSVYDELPAAGRRNLAHRL